MRLRITALVVLLFSAFSFSQTLEYVTHLAVNVDEDFRELHVVNDPGLQELYVSGLTGNALARGKIGPGINQVFVRWDSLNPLTPSETLMANAWTHWTDVVVISAPGLEGTLGYFTASLRVFGSAGFHLTGAYASGDPYELASVYGFWDSWIGTSTDEGASFLVGGWFGNWWSDHDGNVWYVGDELNQPMTEVELQFIYGEPFLLRMNLEAYLEAQNPYLHEGTVEGALDFSHTAYWNGIGGFFDAAGNPTNPNFWSQSGIDWRQGVVPEPATGFVLAAGLFLMTRPLRRRRRRENGNGKP